MCFFLCLGVWSALISFWIYAIFLHLVLIFIHLEFAVFE